MSPAKSQVLRLAQVGLKYPSQSVWA